MKLFSTFNFLLHSGTWVRVSAYVSLGSPSDVCFLSGAGADGPVLQFVVLVEDSYRHGIRTSLVKGTTSLHYMCGIVTAGDDVESVRCMLQSLRLTLVTAAS